MARPLRIQYPGTVYHVTCRGNERKALFQDDVDRHRFLQILAQSLTTYTVKLSMSSSAKTVVRLISPSCRDAYARYT